MRYRRYNNDDGWWIVLFLVPGVISFLGIKVVLGIISAAAGLIILQYLKSQVFVKCDHNIYGGKTLNRCALCKQAVLEEIQKTKKIQEQKLLLEEEQRLRRIEENRFKLQNEEKRLEYMRWVAKGKAKITNVYRQVLDRFETLSPREFELEIAAIFRSLGFEVTVTPTTNDKGRDAIMRKNGEFFLLECKHYKISKVGRPEIQKFYGAVSSEKAKKGYFVTSGYFHNTAIEYAKSLNLELIDRSKLNQLSLNCQNNLKSEPVNVICVECKEIHDLDALYICQREIINYQCRCGHSIKINVKDYLDWSELNLEPKPEKPKQKKTRKTYRKKWYH